MKYIAHRGLTNGPDVNLENRPEQILQTLSQGYDCEIDLWAVNSDLYLGHDRPDYPISRDFIREPGLWIHAKNLAAFRFLLDTNYNFFWHQNDDYTLTSHNFIWAYPGKELTQRSIMVMPEWKDPALTSTTTANCAGICSDWIEKIKSMR